MILVHFVLAMFLILNMYCMEKGPAGAGKGSVPYPLQDTVLKVPYLPVIPQDARTAESRALC